MDYMITATGLHDHNTSPTTFETFKKHLATIHSTTV